MSTNQEVQAHLESVRDSINVELKVIGSYLEYGAMMTSGSETSERAKVTTVPANSLHANDCVICTRWDGSNS